MKNLRKLLSAIQKFHFNPKIELLGCKDHSHFPAGILSYLIFIFAFLFFSIRPILNAQAVQSANEEDLQTSASIIASEKIIDEKIITLNKRFMNHAKLLKVMVKVLPAQTVLFKGKANGDKCVLSEDQEADTNDCIHLEIYDFVGSEHGLSSKGLGARNKFLTLYFGGTASAEKDYRKIPPRELSQIFTQVHMSDFVNGEQFVSEISDMAPMTTPLQNNNYFLFYQLDGYPFRGTEESPGQKGIGRYSLEKIENTTSNDIRNAFKKKFYVKHLDIFDKLFQKIYNFNDRDGNQHYRNNIQMLKESLKY